MRSLAVVLGLFLAVQQVAAQAPSSAPPPNCSPLAAVPRDTSAMCELVEEFLSAESGMRVKQECNRGEHPRCHFLLQSVA